MSSHRGEVTMTRAEHREHALIYLNARHGSTAHNTLDLLRGILHALLALGGDDAKD